MFKRALWFAAFPLALAGCAADETPETEMAEMGEVDAVDQPPVVAPMDTGMSQMASTLSLSGLNDSGVSGEATVAPAGDQTEVSVTLNDVEPNSTHPGHIHQGTCDSVGAVVVPLSEIAVDASGSGMMTTTVAIAPDSAMAGGHIIVYHDAGGAPMVCGEIEEHVM